MEDRKQEKHSNEQDEDDTKTKPQTKIPPCHTKILCRMQKKKILGFRHQKGNAIGGCGFYLQADKTQIMIKLIFERKFIS